MGNEYYVYQVKLGEEVVYIGKGNGDRIKHATSGSSHNFSLNEAWFSYKFNGTVEPISSIIDNFKSDLDSLKEEERLILLLQPRFNIKGKTLSKQKKVQSKTMSRLEDPFVYYSDMPDKPSYYDLWHPEDMTRKIFNYLRDEVSDRGEPNYKSFSRFYSDLYDINISAEYVAQIEVYVDRREMLRLE